MQHPNLGDAVIGVVVAAASNNITREMFVTETEMIMVSRQDGAVFTVEVQGSTDNSTYVSLGTVVGVRAVTVSAVRYKWVRTIITTQPACVATFFADRRLAPTAIPSHYTA